MPEKSDGIRKALAIALVLLVVAFNVWVAREYGWLKERTPQVSTERELIGLNTLALGLIDRLEGLPEKDKTRMGVEMIKEKIALDNLSGTLEPGTHAHTKRTIDALRVWFDHEKGKKLPPNVEAVEIALTLLEERLSRIGADHV